MAVAASVTRELTPLQQGMVFHYLLEGRESGVDLEQVVADLEEALDPSAFEDAWKAVLARHDLLRASIQWEGVSEPVAVLHREVDLAFEVEDWRDRSPAERESAFLRHLEDDRARGFDLGSPPLMRIGLFRMGDEAFRLLWTVHHILVDGRTLQTVLEEVFSFYEAARKGETLSLPEPPSFGRYVEWLRDRDTSDDEAFWRELLKGYGGPPPLPSAGTTSESDNEAGLRTVEAATLSADVTRSLRETAKKNDLTLNTLFQASWALVMHRFTGDDDVTFGAIRAGRRGTVDGAEAMVGLFINTLPIRVQVSRDEPLESLARRLRKLWLDFRNHEHVSPQRIQEWSELSSGSPLFEAVVNFQDPPWTEALRGHGGPWSNRRFDIHNKLVFPLMVKGNADGDQLVVRMEYDPTHFETPMVRRMLDSLVSLLEAASVDLARKVGDYPIPPPEERQRTIEAWNDTAKEYPRDACIHDLVAQQAQRTPDAPAVTAGPRTLSYAELETRANAFAHRLRAAGVDRGDRVGVLMERSRAMVPSLLAILKVGAAYVPLDPNFPRERLAFMMEDAGLTAILTDGQHRHRAPVGEEVNVIQVDIDRPVEESEAEAPHADVSPADLAYVIYTSGSTGRPKGVQIQHRNVINFFAGMDDRIGGDRPGVWLAVTSISFDISVLELFWTLTRGFHVVLHPEAPRPGEVRRTGVSRVERPMEFSLFYFAADADASGKDCYRLLMDGARFADRNGLSAVWTPERHFHAFGGLYPSPAVMGAALAAVTDRIQIRAGSVVLPLHNPIRVAEDWSVVDNLSGGRVGLSFASGWHDQDFVLSPDNYEDRRDITVQGIETVRALWRGEGVTRTTPKGKEVQLSTLPRPIQKELPVWVTAGGSPNTFRNAGRLGANVLTHLLGQSLEDLAEKLRAYREAWQEEGHEGEGHVSLMLHTYIGTSLDEVLEKVREPFREYLRTSVGLISALAEGRGQDMRSAEFSDEDMEALLDHAFNRYFETSALMGTPDGCVEMVDRLKEVGVDEVACLIDFGVDHASTMSGLERLLDLVRRANPEGPATADEPPSVGDQIRRHDVTHLQCTPSMARILLAEEANQAAIADLQTLMIGGEAFPKALAEELGELVSGSVVNMYGPTETTIWSSTHEITGTEGTSVPIGHPIANTSFFVVDRHGDLVPVGVPGELWIGGDGVVPGYLGRPELTEERFPTASFRGRDERLYRTGDLVRQREDGSLDFLGRLDHQVKIRGHRIELGEIEAELARHPGVKDCVVIARETTPGDLRLVAYVIPDGNGALDARAADRRLREVLPESMIPSAFVTLDGFPLTPNAKVDRARLPAPESEPTRGRETFAPPSSDLEKVIADIWSDVLRLSEVGLDDNFFDLGGHSLLTVRVHNLLREAVEASVTITDLFRFPTVRSLAAHLGRDGVTDTGVQERQERGATRREALRSRRGRRRSRKGED